MNSYLLAAVLKRTVLDDVSLKVRASSLDHAYHIARQFLENYPENVKTWSDSVPFFVVDNRKSVDSETVDIEEVTDEQRA